MAANVKRCKRCGTPLRKPRPACPGCGAELAEPATPASADAPESAGSLNAQPAPAVAAALLEPGTAVITAPTATKSAHAPVKASPPPPARRGRPGLKMCPICFGTVAEAEMVEHENVRICSECFTNLSRKKHT